MMNKKEFVVNAAMRLAKEGRHFRFFSLGGEIWECYQSQYLPLSGQRAWIAEPIRIYIMHDNPPISEG